MHAGCDEKITLTTPQMKDLLKLGSLAGRQTERILSIQIRRNIWEPVAWDTLREKLAASAQFKASLALQKICHQIAQTSQNSSSAKPKLSGKVGSKRKVGEGGDDEDVDIKKVKRTKSKA